MLRRWAAAGVLLAAACSAGAPRPATLDTANEACRRCRMMVSDPRFAAQIVAPGDEPVFFDDLGCLRDHLQAGGRLPAGAAVFVADHRTAEWVEAGRAVFSRQPGLATPMRSGLIAHRDAASRDLDPEAKGGGAVPAGEILGPLAGPGGR